jgi:uncharacterized membrane protein
MDKDTFISELEKSLAAHDVADSDEIIAEYKVHFSRKIADGYSEAEIAKKLGDPKKLAKEYVDEEGVPAKSAKPPILLGLALTDIFSTLFFIVAYAWVLALAIGTVAFVFSGACLIAAPFFSVAILGIPYLPYLPGALLGVAIIAVGVLTGVLTINCFALVKRTTAEFVRWQKAIVANKKYLRYSLFPLLGSKLRRVLRPITLIAVLIGASCFTVAYVMMASMAGSLGFWHVWEWFAYVG